MHRFNFLVSLRRKQLMMQNIKVTLSIFFILLISLAGCRKEIKPSWDDNLFLPLVRTSLSINNLLPDSLLQVNPDHTVTLVYQNTIYNVNLDTLVSVPDTITSKYYPGFPGAVISPGQVLIDNIEDESFDFNGAQVTRLDVRNGYILIDFTNTLHEEVVITYRILSATKDGQYFEIYETVPPATNQPYHYLRQLDISGYTLDLSGQTHMSSNKIVTQTKVMLAATANPVALTAQDEFNLLATFGNVQISYAKGYFAGQTYTFGPSETSINLFNHLTSGTLDLESIKMTLGIKNGFGVDARVTFKSLSSVNTHTGTEIALNSPIIGQTINIGRATETFNPVTPVIPTQYNFDLSGSNILDMIESFPDRLRYTVDIVTNPLGNASAGNDFVYYGNNIETYLNMEIPLSFIASDLCLADTVDFKPGSGKNNENIRGGELVILADNGFPFTASLDIYTIDEQGVLLDKLVEDQLIKDAPVDVNGFAELPLRSEIHIPVDKIRIDNLFNATRIAIIARFNTTAVAGQYTKIYDSYHLDLKVTAHFNYVIE
jgi:hypothetical protein